MFFFTNRGVDRVVHKYTHIQLTIRLYKICSDGTMKHHPNNVTLTPHPAQTDNRETCSQGRGRAGEMRPYHQMGDHTVSGEQWDCLSGAQSIPPLLGHGSSTSPSAHSSLTIIIPHNN